MNALNNKNTVSTLLLISTAILMVASTWMVFFWVPTDINQGPIQRILYVHVPLAWGSMMAIVVVAVASVIYLFTKRVAFDRFAFATAEVGVVFGILMLLSGILWAKPVWGVWWTGEAKLTTALVLVFIYIAYLMFRWYFPPGRQLERVSAVVAIFGAVDTPLIYFSAQLWERAHPPAVVGPLADQTTSSFAAEFGLTLLVSSLAFTLLLVSLIYQRYNIRATQDNIAEIKSNTTITTERQPI